MDRKMIKDLKVGEKVDIYLLVGDLTEKETANQSPYLEFTMEDGEQKVSAKMWSATKKSLPGVEVGDVVKVRAKVGEWNNKLQLTIELCRKVDDTEISKDDFIRKSPIDAVAMYDEIMDIVLAFKDEELKTLTKAILEDNEARLLYYPASKTVHHDIKSGLLFHILRMLRMGLKMSEVYEGVNKDLLCTGIILHDIGKVEEIDANEDGVADDYTKVGKLLGHIIQGIKMVCFTAEELGISSETTLLVEHMIASHHGEEAYGAVKRPMFVEAQLLHYLDNIDAKVFMFDSITTPIEEGEFSDRQFFLNNIQVYKHK